MTRSAAAAGLAAAALALQVAGVLWLAAGPILTDDAWWHLAMGEVYARQGPWPAGGDPLLHTAFEDAPIQHEWLFGVALHLAERVAGLHGLRVLHGLAVLGILGLALSIFRRAAAGAWAPACLAAGVWLTLSWWRLFQLRPDLASIAATLLLYRLLFEPGAPPGRGRVLAAAALLGVWANLHSLFAVGLALLVAALAGLGVEAALARGAAARGAAPARAAPEADPDRGARARAWGAALGLGGLASLANPRGLEQHLTFFTSTAGTGIWQVVDEWLPFHPFSPDAALQGLSPLAWALTDALLLGLLAAGGLGLWRFWQRPSRPRLQAFDPVGLALAAAGAVALGVSIRFLWLGGLLIGVALLRASRGLLQRPGAQSLAAAAAVALAALFFGLGDLPAAARTLPSRPADWLAEPYLRDKYPVAGVRFLRETGIEGRLYNKYSHGGFLGYWLAPRLRTFVDSRTEHYPAQVLDDYGAVGMRRGLSQTLARHDVNVFLAAGFPRPVDRDGLQETTDHLAGDPDWRLVSRSVRHAVYLRRSDAANLARVDAWYRSQGVPFDPDRGFDPLAALEASPEWAVRWELLPRGGAGLLEATRAADPRQRRQALDSVGRCLALLGAHERQIQVNREVLALEPGAADPRRRVAYALLRLGRGVEARRELTRLAREAPEHPLTAAAVRAGEAFLRARSAELAQPGSVPAVPAEAQLDRFPLLASEEMRWLSDAFRSISLTDLETPRGLGPPGRGR